MSTHLGSLTVTDLNVEGELLINGAPLGQAGTAAPQGKAPAVADSEATSVKQLQADHNALLAALRQAGVLAEE